MKQAERYRIFISEGLVGRKDSFNTVNLCQLLMANTC